MAGVPLLRRTEVGFEPRLVGEIDVLARAAYGVASFDAAALRRGLCVAAQALNDRDMVRAMIATLHLKLPELDVVGASRIAAVDAVLANYSPDQPRDWHGRWTTEGDGSGPIRSPGPGPVGDQLADISYHQAKATTARQSKPARADRNPIRSQFQARKRFPKVGMWFLNAPSAASDIRQCASPGFLMGGFGRQRSRLRFSESCRRSEEQRRR